MGLSSAVLPFTSRVLVSDISLVTFTTVVDPDEVEVVDTSTGTNTTLFQLAERLSQAYMAEIMPEMLLNV